MDETKTLVSQLSLKLDGELVQQPLLGKVLEVVVDQHAHLPDMFTIRIHDRDLKLLDEGPFQLTRVVEVSAEDADGTKQTLIEGEITAIEPDFGEGMVAELVVRGYDKSHRLYRETKSRAFLNKKDSDLASEIARENGLQSEVDTTNTVYDHIYQHNESDLAFLMRRAWRIGFECFVDGKKLHFRKPPDPKGGVTVRWGNDLLWFRPRMTLAEQVNEVTVRGWDPASQKAIVGKAQKGQLYPAIEEEKNGAEWAEGFGNGRLVIVDQPVASQAEADVLAAARMDELSGAFIEAEGAAFRRPDIKAGRAVQLEALGERFSGSYLVTGATHIFNERGLETRFTVRGTRTGSLLEQVNGETPQQRWPGVVIGVVTNSDDPEGWGRVKVKFPWMTDDAESDWARVVGIGAGKEAGLFIMPEVNDEVLVAFEHADFSRPVVLGGVWNGKHTPPPEAVDVAQGEKPLVRTWHSRTGHRITIYDNAENKIEVQSKGGLTITLDDTSSTITISGGGDIKVEAGGNLDLTAGRSVKLEASASIDIKAGQQVNVKGAMINLN